MIEIKHVQQPTSQTCAHACLAMATGLPVEYFMERFDAPELGPTEETLAFIESHILPQATSPFAPYPYYGVYYVTTPSLNQLGRSHAIIVTFDDLGDGVAGYKVYDPNKGRDGMNVYEDGDVNNGKISQSNIFYLDYKALESLRIPKIDDIIKLTSTNTSE